MAGRVTFAGGGFRQAKRRRAPRCPRFVTILLLLPTLMAAALLFPRPAAADAVKGSVSAAVENGFARLIFTLGNDVESQVRVANNIVVISFDRPVDVNVDHIRDGTRDYIGAARRDPDGKAVRLALTRHVTMNSMAAGDRLFIDLLPAGWSGLPPGLPREVIEELARRARDAEKKLRQEHLADADRKVPLIRVRIASQPTFTRYTFQLPEPTSVAADNRKDKLTLTFNGMFTFDLSDAQSALPATLQSIDSELDQDTAVVRFVYRGPVDVRTFREDNSYVVDVGSAEIKDGKPLDMKPADKLAALAADLMVKRTAPPADVEPPQTVPAKAAAGAAEPKRVPAPAPAPAPAPVARRETARPAPAPAKESPAASSERSMSAGAPTPFLKPVPSATAVSAGAGDAAPPPAAVPASGADAVPPSATMSAAGAPAPDAAVSPPPKAIAAPPAPEPQPEVAAAPLDPPSTIKALLKVQGENLTLRFPFAGPTPAAVFRRADVLWLVFDTDAEIKLADLANDPSRNIKNATVRRLQEASVVRITLDRPKLTSVAMEGATWVVNIGSEIIAPTRALTIVRNGSTPSQATATVQIVDPHQVHRLADPEAGDNLWVVTALA